MCLQCEPFLFEGSFLMLLIFGTMLCVCNGWCFNKLLSRAELKTPESQHAWGDGCLKLEETYSCHVEKEGEHRCSRYGRLLKGNIKHCAVTASFVLKIIALVTITNTMSDLEDMRKSENLGTFDTCCERVTNLEVLHLQCSRLNRADWACAGGL